MRHHRVDLLLTTGTVVALAVLGMLHPSPASAASTDDVLVSQDGVNFSPSLSRGLFDGTDVLVPGASVSSVLWVKNPSTDAAQFQVSVRDLRASSATFARAMTLTVWDSATQVSRERSVATIDSCAVMVPSHLVAAGAVSRVVLTFTMGDVDRTTAQGEKTDFDLLVAMRGNEAGALPPSACRDGASVDVDSLGYRSLASTGSTFPDPLFIGGGLVLGIGGALLLGRRRRRTS